VRIRLGGWEVEEFSLRDLLADSPDVQKIEAYSPMVASDFTVGRKLRSLQALARYREY
jgi:hypothetical protein